ncbi:hypothetical protein L2725_00490 [Shewanella corallii]|uniref:Lipoprotein n=1 Tax=Shewanella corallii TaxID=560080 RepID=A0ABT0N1N8_9GAMM|nr:hypothetical protein [Shewanella corallii]MCL2912270.1 hypothetical protein [Shewanella corallii]
MLKTRAIIVSLALILTTSGCTTTHNFYTGEEDLAYGEEFSLFNTIMLPVAIVGVAAIAYGASQGGGSSYSGVSCKGYYCNYDAAWDYLPGSGEYRCRDTSNGQFVYNHYCASQLQQDNWY